MNNIPTKIAVDFDAVLEQRGVGLQYRPHFRKWLRFYLDFCQKYGFAAADRASFRHYDRKLRDKKQPDSLRHQARQALTIYYGLLETTDGYRASGDNTKTIAVNFEGVSENAEEKMKYSTQSVGRGALHSSAHSAQPVKEAEGVQKKRDHSVVHVKADSSVDNSLKETGASWVWVYESLGSAIKVRHYSPKTLVSYRSWVRKLQAFVKSKDPRLVSVEDVKSFLTYLAVKKHVAAST